MFVIQGEKMLAKKEVLVIGGSGCTGSLIVNDILKYSSIAKVTVGCRNTSKVKGDICSEHIDIEDTNEAIKKVKKYDLVLLALGPFEKFGNKAHKICIEADVDCVDVNDGINATKKILELNDEAKRRNVRIFTGIGLSPGLTTLLIKLSMQKYNGKRKKIRTRLFAGSGQNIGVAAVKALINSFSKTVPRIINGELVFVKANDNDNESFYYFPRPYGKNFKVYCYTTPEVLTLIKSKNINSDEIEEFDYRVHFEMLSTFVATLLRNFKFIKKELCINFIANMGKKVCTKLVSAKPKVGKCCICAECETLNDKSIFYVNGKSSYELTASFHGAIVEMILLDKIKGNFGVNCFEDLEYNEDILIKMLKKRNIFITEA